RPGHYVFKVPDVLPDEAIPPVNCALCQVLHGLEYSGMKFGDVIVIQGAGGLGIYAAAVAAEKGASKVISIDGQTPRLAMAKNCGAPDLIDMHEFPTREARVARVKESTDGRGADVVVEVVGIAAATLEGLDMVRVNGTFVDIGNIVPQTITLPATKVITQQITWKGLMHYDPWIMPSALDFLVRTRDKYPLSKVVSHSFPLSEVNRAFEMAEWQGKKAGTAATRGILKPWRREGSRRRPPRCAHRRQRRADARRRGHRRRVSRHRLLRDRGPRRRRVGRRRSAARGPRVLRPAAGRQARRPSSRRRHQPRLS